MWPVMGRNGDQACFTTNLGLFWMRLGRWKNMTLTDKDYSLFSDYWHSLPRDQSSLLPKRSVMNPALITRLLPFVFMLHAKADMVLDVRLSGTALDAISMQPMTGRNYMDICPPNEKEMYWHTMKLVREQPCGLMILRDVMFRDGRVFRLRSLNFPMLDEEGEAVFLLGLMASERMQHRFDDAPAGESVSSALLKLEAIDIGNGMPAILQGVPDDIDERLRSIT